MDTTSNLGAVGIWVRAVHATRNIATAVVAHLNFIVENYTPGPPTPALFSGRRNVSHFWRGRKCLIRTLAAELLGLSK
jgi:hypothetical protein